MCRKELLSYFVKVWRPLEWPFSINKQERRGGKKSGGGLSSSLSRCHFRQSRSPPPPYLFSRGQKKRSATRLLRGGIVSSSRRALVFSQASPPPHPRGEVGWKEAEVKYIFTAKLFLALHPPCGHHTLGELLTGSVFNPGVTSSTSVFPFTALSPSSN